MRILFAAPDRDLLECYKAILEADFGETVTAFDGTQVIALLSAERFDVLLLDRDIPRIGYDRLIARAQRDGLPVIVLTDDAVSTAQLTQEVLPNAFLLYPFTPEQVGRVLRDTMEKASSGETLRFGGLGLDVSGFRIVGGPRVTAKEIDAVRSLINGGAEASAGGAYICALNEKFARIGAGARIRYRAKKGFELVTEDE